MKNQKVQPKPQPQPPPALPSSSSSSTQPPTGGTQESPQFFTKVSRRVRACDECRKHKIRCSLGPDEKIPCVRCDRMGLNCRLTKSLQSILEERNTDDGKWKEGVEKRFETIFTTLETILKRESNGDDALDKEDLLTRLQFGKQQTGNVYSPEAITNINHQNGVEASKSSTSASGSTSSKRRRVSILNDTLETNENKKNNDPLDILANAASENVSHTWNQIDLDPASAPGHHLSQLDNTTNNELDSTMEGEQIQKNPSKHLDSAHKAIPSNSAKRSRSDVIERGIITINQTCVLVDIYLRYLDNHVYSIVGSAHSFPNEHSDIRLRLIVQSIRKSPLLLLAVCTVAALHCSSTIHNDGTIEENSGKFPLQQQQSNKKHVAGSTASKLYATLHDEFVRAAAQQSFVRHQSLDDIRALLIGSWWLRDLSWILTGSAVRLATERGMQEAYKKCSDMKAGKRACRIRMERGDIQACEPGEAIRSTSIEIDNDDDELEKEAYEATRLYYLVYVADHQAAIPFSRPPMTRQHAAVRNVRAWLAGCKLATEEDARLAAQVELWVIAHDVLDDFGVDVQQALTRKQVLEEIPKFFSLVDQWQGLWQKSVKYDHNRFWPMDLEISLHAEMMRLFIAAHIFRSPSDIDPLAIESEDEVEESMWPAESIERRPTFANKSKLYSIYQPNRQGEKDERSERYMIGRKATQTATNLIEMFINPSTFSMIANENNKRKSKGWNRDGIYGQPIYPFSMLIFACLFLHKLSKRNPQIRIMLPDCSMEQTLNFIEGVANSLQNHLVPFCVEEHICGTVLPGLLSLLRNERVRYPKSVKGIGHTLHEKGTWTNNPLQNLSQVSNRFDVQHDPISLQHSTNTQTDATSALALLMNNVPSTDPTSFVLPNQSPIDSTTPGFSFDLQSLDLLSDLRYLSGVSDDLALWEFPNEGEGTNIQL